MRGTKHALSLVVTGSLVMLAAPAQAAEVTTTVSQGPAAEVTFSTLPSEEPPTPGVVYETVYVFGSDQATPDTGGVPTDFAFVDVSRFTFTDTFEQVLVSDTFGGTYAPGVSFTEAKDLTTASLTATFDVLKQITPAHPGGVPVAGGNVTMTWTSSGPLVRTSSREQDLSPGQGLYLFLQHGRYRDGTASGSVLGSTCTGSDFASTMTGKTVERLVLH